MIRLDAGFRRLLSEGEAGNRESLRTLLQHAVMLEHSTIPPYLYALYSSNPARNPAVADIIQSVVVEEMLHLTLAANVLNAIGGTPQIDRPEFVPTDPGKLPGGVDHDLVVGLEKCSITLVKDVFLSIEEPEDPQDYPTTHDAALLASTEQKPVTIGEFYRGIEKSLRQLQASDFPDPPRHQIGPDLMDDAVVVTDVDSAVAAIDVIVEQGEGTANSPLEVVGNGYAHYYRFKQIVEHGALEPGGTAGYHYDAGGHPIALDADAVYPVPRNPKRADYAPGTAARRAVDTFNYTYGGVLSTLHSAFNGQPDLLSPAINRMMSLRQLALDMMSGRAVPGEHLGPTFEMTLVNPSVNPSAD